MSDSKNEFNNQRDWSLAQVRDRLAERDTEVDLSLVAPVFQEEDNLEPLYGMVVEGLKNSNLRWELLLVDDGSRDSSWDGIKRLGELDPRVRGLRFGANRGQSAAMASGMAAAHGRLIATLDADLQNDPKDLPSMITELERVGADVIVGFRAKRQDAFVRRWSSKLANRLRNRLTGDTIRDTGCSLKVFTRDAAASIPWFNGIHRFLPTVLRYQGFRVEELAVSHHARRFGESKYGISNRAFRTARDLFAVRWMRSRMLTVGIAEVSDPEVRVLVPRGRANKATDSARVLDHEQSA